MSYRNNGSYTTFKGHQSINQQEKRRLPPGFQMIIPVNDYGNDTIQYIKHTLTVWGFYSSKKRFVFCPFYLIWCCYFFFVLAKSSKMWRDIGFVPLKDFLWFRFFSHHHYHHHHLRRKYWKEKNPIIYEFNT